MAKRPKAAAWLVGIAGALILLSSAAHGFLGWKAVRAAMAPHPHVPVAFVMPGLLLLAGAFLAPADAA